MSGKNSKVDSSGGVQEKVNNLRSPDGELNWPMMDFKNIIVEGHHTIVAMELCGYLDEHLIKDIKEETNLMLKKDNTNPENWIHGMAKTPSSDVKIFDSNGDVIRNAKET